MTGTEPFNVIKIFSELIIIIFIYCEGLMMTCAQFPRKSMTISPSKLNGRLCRFWSLAALLIHFPQLVTLESLNSVSRSVTSLRSVSGSK